MASLRPVPLIQDGQSVSGAVTNRPTEALAQNSLYLLSRIEALEAMSGVYVRNASADPALLVGQPAFYNAVTHRFEKALGDAETDETTGELIPKASANVRGIVTARATDASVDVLTSGSATVDLANAIAGTPVEGGLYYLSNNTAGRLLLQRPAIGIPVLQVGALQSDGTYQVFVNPQFADFLNQHRHFSYQLVCLPAGDTSPPGMDGRHEITDPDDSIEGWLPADSDIFDGLAPEGALFGYNLAVSGLANLWPPVPLTSVCMEMTKNDGVAAGVGVSVPLGSDQLCVIDQHGIWWMSDCEGDVPWPTDLDTGVEDSASAAVMECPRDVPMQLKVFFVRQSFLGGNTAVLSLRAAEGSNLTVRCAGQTNEATTGHLEIDLDLAPEDGVDDEAGYVVFKSLDGNKFNRGPVVSAVRAASANVTVVGSGPAVTIDDVTYATGAIAITVDQELEDTELSVETIRLQGVTDEPYQNVVGLNFPAARTSSFRGQIRVPSKDVLPENAQVKLRLWWLGRAAGTVAADAVTATYRVLSRPSGTAIALPTSDSDLGLDVSQTLAGANRYYEVESDGIDISPGDVVLFTLQRAGDAYAGDLFLIRRAGVIVVAE